MSADLDYAFGHLKNDIKKELFFIPFDDRREDYYPRYLTGRLQTWLDKYKRTLQPLVDNIMPFADEEATDVTLKRTEEVIRRLPQVITLYYEGKVLEATQHFNQIMDDLFVPIKQAMPIEASTEFYRSRPGGVNEQFVRKDLFHLPFQMRHKAASHRYSIPGFPALYLADSTYTCWEECSRFRLRDVHFSRFVSQRPLRVIDIRLVDDFYDELFNDPDSINQALSLFKYIAIFPLILACTVPVQHREGNFKPEYIIPQLLLQYVSSHPAIDGIRFPSSRINYERLTAVSGYNYVFPVRNNQPSGYCSVLAGAFHLTEPTSIELEEVRFNPTIAFVDGGDDHDDRYIELSEGVRSFYGNTSFGKIEKILKTRRLAGLSPDCA